MRFRVLFVFLFGYPLFFTTGHAQNLIDSLENYTSKAKPGWDQIDHAIGLGRLYLNNGDLEKAKVEIARVNALSEKYNLPEGKAHALILENVIAYLFDYDADKAIRLCEEAISVAKRAGDHNAYIYAGFQLAENYIWEKGNIEKGREILDGLIAEIDDRVHLKNVGSLYKAAGALYTRSGEHDKALAYYKKAQAVFRQMVTDPKPDPRIGRISTQEVDIAFHFGSILDSLGDLYFNMGQTENAVATKTEALEVFEKRGIDVDIAWMRGNLGKLFFQVGRYQESLENLQQARKTFEDLDLQNDKVRVNTTLVNLFLELKDYDTAEKYAYENIKYLKEIGHALFYSSNQMQCIQIALLKGELEKAKEIINEAQVLVDSLENKENEGWLYQLKGDYEVKIEQYELAVASYQHSLSVYTSIKKTFNIANVNYALGQLFFQQKEYDSATYYTQTALATVQNTKDIDLARNAFLLLSKIHEANGNYQLAYANHQAFFAYNDSLFTANAQAKLKEEQVRQNVVAFKNEKEMAEQNAALLAQRNDLYVAAGVALLIMLSLMGVLYFNLRKVKSKIQEQNLQLTQLNQTKDKFFGIIAHDLRSPLLGLQNVGDQIRFLIRKKETQRLDDISGNIESTAKKLTELLDNLLNWSLLQNGMIPYHPEKVNLRESAEEALGLMKPLAEVKEIKLINSIVEDVYVHADPKAVSTILRNIISNALKFTDRHGEVKVDVKAANNQSTIIINDTGTGISAELLPKLFDLDKKSQQGTQGEKGSGLGLILCKELVELNKGTIKVISDLGKGSSFIFNLPNFSASM